MGKTTSVMARVSEWTHIKSLALLWSDDSRAAAPCRCALPAMEALHVVIIARMVVSVLTQTCLHQSNHDRAKERRVDDAFTNDVPCL